MCKILSIVVIVSFMAASEGYIEEAHPQTQSGFSPTNANVSLETRNLLSSGRRMSVAGSVMFFTATAIDLRVLLPISIKISNELRDIEEPDMDDLVPSLSLLAASITVGGLKKAGPIVACAGTSRSYNAYRTGFDSSIPDIP